MGFSVEHAHSAIVQSDDYYPFGLSFNSYKSENSIGNKYLYNGKELEEETGWMDYGARMYMADIVRFGTVDPMADLMEDHTPYHYTYNNPINFTDPTGMFPQSLASTFVDPEGKIIEHRDDNDPAIYYVGNVDAWKEGGKKKDGLSVIGYEKEDYNYEKGKSYDAWDPNQNAVRQALLGTGI